MAFLINLPAPQDPPIPDFTIGVDLDGVSYTLRFIWDPTVARWLVRVLDALNQVVLMAERRVVADWPLWRAAPVRTPSGYLIARDTSGRGEPPTLTDLGTRVQLFYITAAEVAALAGGA